MSEPLHDGNERTYTNSLLEQSDVSKYSENRKVYKVALTDWSDAVTGWKFSSPALKSQTAPAAVKKRRPVERSYTDISYGNGFNTNGDEYWSNSSASADYKATVRCIHEDFEAYPIPPWKSNTEPGTYRYIPDNGSYRTLKFMYDDRKEWYTIRKRYPEKVSNAYHQNRKRIQREMRRQLKKDLNLERERSTLSTVSNASASALSTARTDVDQSAHVDLMGAMDQESVKESNRPTADDKPKAEINDKVNVKLSSHINNYFNTPEKALKSEPIPRPLYKTREPRVKSTQSDGAVNQVNKMRTIHESEPVTPVPQYSIPTGGQMFKSASDLFIENFSSRISALEDEIKRDSRLLRKNESDLQKIQTRRSKHKDSQRNGLKEGTLLANGTPRISFKTEALTSDIFSVKSVGQKDQLKPLEKTQGYLKHNLNQTGDYFPSSGPHNSPSKMANQNYGFQSNTNSESDRSNYKTNNEATNLALINTLTSTKINTNNYKKGTKGFSTPATITICDTSSANGDTQLLQTNQAPDAFRNLPIVLDKKLEKKGSGIQSVPSMLPEISGKRLEVTSVSHRLL